MSRNAHGFAGHLFTDTLHLKEHRARLHFGHKKFWAAFAATHLYVLRFTRHRRVRKDTNPDFTTPFDVTSHGLTSGLNLARGNALMTLGLQGKVTVGNVVTPGSHTVN